MTIAEAVGYGRQEAKKRLEMMRLWLGSDEAPPLDLIEEWGLDRQAKR